MAILLFSDDIDPGMRYESLARYAYDCKAWGGPDNIAHQSKYNSLFVPKVTGNGFDVINKIIDVIIDKVNSKKKDELLKVQKTLFVNMKQVDFIELLDNIIKIVEGK